MNTATSLTSGGGFNEAARCGALGPRSRGRWLRQSVCFNEAARCGAVGRGGNLATNCLMAYASMRRPAVGPWILGDLLIIESALDLLQ